MSLLSSLFLLQTPLMPEQASNFAWEIDLFYGFLVALTVVFSVGIAVVAFIFMLKYRRRRADEIGVPIEGDLRLELTWTIVPFLISMFIFAWGAKLYYQMYTDPTEALEIFVTGKQWMWRAQHPDGQREINELHLPVGRRVKLTMTSEDVLHAYSIPAFRTKADIVPGRYTTLWFVPTKTGTHHLFCAEYCGTQHSGMIGRVVVMEPAEYQTWLSGGPREASPAAAGQRLFASLACNTCHYEKDGGRGPTLTGLYGTDVKLDNGATVKFDDTYIRESILNPTAKVVAGFQPIMPTFQGQVSEEQILQIIAYIKSVGNADATNGQPAAASTPAPRNLPAAQQAQPNQVQPGAATRPNAPSVPPRN